jgi:hypothetical protein
VTSGEVFSIRRISFLGRQVPVLLQSSNGPCSLLAVANALLLRGTLKLGDKEDFLTSSDLVSRLGHLCETLNAKAIQEDANFRETVHGLLEHLPKLLSGLDVNCQFSACAEFEYTRDLALFDCFGVKLFHVWVEPKVAAVATSWNVLAERLAISSEIRGNLEQDKRVPTPEEDDILAEAIWLEEWLEDTRTQATELGFQGLMQAVKEHEVCVLFRNNHFTTIFKPRSQTLCSLLTDISFESMASSVWESLELDGSAGSFRDATFVANCEQQNVSKPVQNWSAAQLVLLQSVEQMGFSRVQAESGLVAVDWRSVEEAVEALLDANGDLPPPPQAASPSHFTTPTTSHCEWRSAQRYVGDFNIGFCPTCGKEFKSKNGLLNHRAVKGH